MASPTPQRPLLPLLATLVVLSCADAQDTQPPNDSTLNALHSRSSTIALAPNNDALWVTSPDDDALIRIDPHTLDPIDRLHLGGAPQHLTHSAAGWVITRSLDHHVALVDPQGQHIADIAVPCGGTRAVNALNLPQGPNLALVSCPHDHRIVVLDLDAQQARATIQAPARPTALVTGAGLVTATSSHGAVARQWTVADIAALKADPWQPIDLPHQDLTLLDDQRQPRSASTFDALDIDPATGQPIGTLQLVDNDGDRQRPPSQGGYGSVIDGQPRIEPRLAGLCQGQYARFDGTNRVFSGPSALAYSPTNQTLWVVNMFTQNVALLACPPRGLPTTAGLTLQDPAPTLELLAHFRVGAGARGIALDPTGTVAYIDVGFDQVIARLDATPLANTPTQAPTLEKRRLAQPQQRWTVEALRGRALFHDATNTHLTPSGVVTCATCHPNGGDDGLNWFIHTEGITRKVRRTAPAWNARAGAAPFHWDGEFLDGASLSRDTTLELMEGDGLVVDFYAIAAYMDQVPAPIPRPMSPEEFSLAQQGRQLFESPQTGCADCHNGPHLSDNRALSVLPPSSDPDAVMPAVITRPLRGVRARAPFLHDGRAQTLESIHQEHNPQDQHGRTSTLTAQERTALRLYLETL